MTVMLKKDIPEEKHYRNHRRVQAVFALADDGYQISRVSGYHISRVS